MEDTGWVIAHNIEQRLSGDKYWSDIGNAYTNDDATANCVIGHTESTHSLEFYFDLDIPSGSTLIDAEFRYGCWTTGPAVYHGETSLIINGSDANNDVASIPNNNVAGTETEYIVGGTSSFGDSWGVTPTLSEANASDFGVTISFYNDPFESDETVYLDYGQIKVYYDSGSSARTHGFHPML